MMLLLVFLLGYVSGMRTFTAPAVLWIMRHGGPWAYVLAAAALFEYYIDVNPKTPSRTAAVGLTCRVLGGAFVGYFGSDAAGIPPLWGTIVAVIGALIGTYSSAAIRLRAIAAIGNVASGIVEDVVTIAAAVAIVAYL